MENPKRSAKANEALNIYVDSTMAVLELDMEGAIININDNYLTLSGYSAEELTDQSCARLYTADFRNSVEFDELRLAWLSGRRLSGIFPQQHKSGRVFWLETEFNPVYDDEGQPVGSLGISRDVTEKTDRPTAGSNTVHQALMVAECGPDGRILAANELYLSTLKYEESEILGRSHSLHFCLDHDEGERNRQAWDYVLDGNSHTLEMQWLSSDGQLIWVEATYSPVFDESGRLERIVVLAQNVTWRVRQQRKDQEALKRLAQLCDKNSNPMLIVDDEGEAIYINERFSEMFGYSREDMERGRAGLMFGPAEREVMPRLYEALRQPETCQLVETVYDKTGRRFWVNCCASRIKVEGEAGLCLALTFTDISALKMKEIMQSKALEAMSQNRPLVDFFTAICREAEKMMPEAIVCVIGLDDKKRLRPLACPSLPTACALVLTGTVPGRNFTASGQAISNAQPVMVEDISAAEGQNEFIRHTFLSAGLHSSWALPIVSSANEVFGTVTFYFRKTRRPDCFHEQMAQLMVRICAVSLEREKIQRSIQRLAMYDELTKLPNRGYFMCSAERMLSAAKKHGQYLTFIMIGLDRFKELNASMGHNQTDEMLNHLARRMQEHCSRPSDFLGRISEDVLGLALADTPPTKSGSVANEINRVISEPLKIGDMTLTPSVSQGICVYPADGTDIETLMHKASLAMRQARRLGHGQFVFSTSEQDELAKESMAMETALRQALGGSELRLHYQPQISLEDGTLFGAEALIRWQSPVFGNVSPGRFLNITENSGLINPLSAWVVEESCRQLGQWRQKGLDVPAVSINVSSTNFKEPTFFAKLSNCMDQYDLYPEDLILELTESVYIDSDCRTISGIDKAYESGLRLSVDDFGTGYSCLSYLHRLPISEIKLDQSFVADFQDNEVSRRISQAINGIGQSLGLNLIAEGVETEEQKTILKEQGWHAAQGFLYSPALPGDEFEDWLSGYMQNKQALPAEPAATRTDGKKTRKRRSSAEAPSPEQKTI